MKPTPYLTEQPKEPPPGCQEMPGFCLDVFDGSAWLRLDGTVTDKWDERGVWPTWEAVVAARDKFYPTP